MLINRETDYAFRLIRNMSEEKPTSISSIVGDEHITAPIAYKVARKLEQGGLLKSVRGNAGGYMLTRSLSDITLYDIFVVMEKDPYVNMCLKEDHVCLNNTRDKQCKINRELRRIQAVLKEEMSKPLSDILADDED